MHINEASDSEFVSVRASVHEFTSNPALSRKREHSNYKLLDSYFQGDGNSMGSEGHYSNLPKDDFRVKYFKTLDLTMAS